MGEICAALFFTFMVVLVLNYLVKEREITADVIAGAICGYLLIGLMWANFFSVLEILQPGSFSVPTGASAESSHFTYYSYVTLTTLGFGDITPLTDQARSLSALEAIVGPIYLAILVARLVGMSISQSIGKEAR
jgi:amino acid transporter